MDYKALREAGIAHIQKLAGHFWTDHNAHDPGITMLEHVCFALTDLSYRSTFEIPDLLAEGNASPEWFSPGKVMTTAPVTINDLRKLLIDVPGVRNVWVFPVIDDYQPRIYYDDTDQSLGLESRGSDSETEILPIKGLYRIMVATKSDVDIDDRKNVVEAVRQRYQANRGLCEDLSSIDLIEDEMIQIKAEIEIGYVNDPESLFIST